MNIRNYNDAEVMDAMQFMEQIINNENLNNVSFTKDETIEEIYDMFVSCYDEFCDEDNFISHDDNHTLDFASRIYNMFLKQILFLDTHPEFSICGTSITYFDNNGSWGELIYPEFPEKQFCQGQVHDAPGHNIRFQPWHRE